MKRLLPQHEDGTCTKLISGEECVFRQVEVTCSTGNSCSPNSSCVRHKHRTGVDIQTPYPSEPASNTAQCKEAVWVDNNRHRLIQSDCLVMPIADCLLQKGIIHKEKYNQIKAEKTSQDQMREVYSALTYAKAKYEFYRVLQELEPQIIENTPLEEFDLRKYRPPTKGVFRLLPAVRNCRKVRISGVYFDSWTAETLASALKMRNSVLSELQLTNGDFSEQSIDILADALNKAECKLEALSLSGNGLGYLLEKVVLIDSPIPNLKDLELSEVGAGWIQYVIDEGLINSKLERLRLNRNPGIRQTCQVLATALSSKLSNLRELDLNHTSFGDSEMEFISTALMSNQCTLEALSLRNNKLTGKGCETLASALIVRKRALRELDLSYNDLHDSGLIALCDALRSPHCSLRRLRLLFCKVTVDGCTPLGSALRSEHCSLRELDLSFNHLTDLGVKLLTEVQRDSRCSLEHLLVEQSKECWVNLKLLRHHACDLTLDPNTAGAFLTLTQENKLATCNEKEQQHPDHPDRFEKFQVMCEEGLTGCHYWEVEYVSKDVGVGVAYKSMPRSGDCTQDFSLGGNEKSWCWNTNNQFCHYRCCQSFKQLEFKLTGVLGVYLDWPAGILSFFEVYPDSIIHLYTEQTTFSEPLHPAFSFLSGGSVHLKTKDKSEVK
ncbi:unnamed protein product [Menidia menidia]|uniref:(Atlantic silverside) hypothetical protein n=1 Tax=Menidia menidia TaxID=238744 RepID=A0A8S4AT47_9TELE|nr:unnamed protein product [Menidia menidia]